MRIFQEILNKRTILSCIVKLQGREQPPKLVELVLDTWDSKWEGRSGYVQEGVNHQRIPFDEKLWLLWKGTAFQGQPTRGRHPGEERSQPHLPPFLPPSIPKWSWRTKKPIASFRIITKRTRAMHSKHGWAKKTCRPESQVWNLHPVPKISPNNFKINSAHPMGLENRCSKFSVQTGPSFWPVLHFF